MAWGDAGTILGPNLLALGYLFAFALLYASMKRTSVWLVRLEAVGRLSLTNYLLQTAVCTTLFYGYGLGWFGQLGVLAGCAIGLALYSLQVAASSWYLLHFRTGPVERLLRMGTYLTLSAKAKPGKRAEVSVYMDEGK
ncbi:DUF418 domain-containing protein [Paenibacillus puerhi]|uniref:DUF418 domain-containing protein n=1 Tax=Paenibacillus puerhi TaxID=2692622 RepID=UPI0013597498|nr:DUF418 domain-containing protein [Paenibacillus puerhi]